MRLLIVEDDTILLEVICRKLISLEHDVIRATDGREAMKMFVLYKPDLVVTDIMLPTKSGMELLSFIRERLDRDTPVIILSSIDRKDQIKDAYELGASDYITKPFILEELISKIESYDKD